MTSSVLRSIGVSLLYLIHITFNSCFSVHLFVTDNHIVLDDSEGDDDFRAFFPCPFCYVEIDVNILCKHLQNEHCFDLKNAVLILSFCYSEFAGLPYALFIFPWFETIHICKLGSSEVAT